MYKTEPMKIQDFIKYAIDKKYLFINYLECIIDEKGYIHLAVPSHQKVLERLALERRGTSINDIPPYAAIDEYIISKYKLCKVYYSLLVLPKHINVLQRNTIRKLIQYNLLSNNLDVFRTDEYNKVKYLEKLSK